MAHTNWYAFKGASRLASDAGVSKAALSRVINRQSKPSYILVCRLVQALEHRLGISLDPREIVAPDGRYPTPSVCQLTGCRGCLPAEAYDENNNLKPEFVRDHTTNDRQDRQEPPNRMMAIREQA